MRKSDRRLLNPQRHRQPVIGPLPQTVAEDRAEVDVAAIGLAYLEVLPLVDSALEHELDGLVAVRHQIGDILQAFADKTRDLGLLAWGDAAEQAVQAGDGDR